MLANPGLRHWALERTIGGGSRGWTRRRGTFTPCQVCRAGIESQRHEPWLTWKRSNPSPMSLVSPVTYPLPGALQDILLSDRYPYFSSQERGSKRSTQDQEANDTQEGDSRPGTPGTLGTAKLTTSRIFSDTALRKENGHANSDGARAPRPRRIVRHHDDADCLRSLWWQDNSQGDCPG